VLSRGTWACWKRQASFGVRAESFRTPRYFSPYKHLTPFPLRLVPREVAAETQLVGAAHEQTTTEKTRHHEQHRPPPTHRLSRRVWGPRSRQMAGEGSNDVTRHSPPRATPALPPANSASTPPTGICWARCRHPALPSRSPVLFLVRFGASCSNRSSGPSRRPPRRKSAGYTGRLRRRAEKTAGKRLPGKRRRISAARSTHSS